MPNQKMAGKKGSPYKSLDRTICIACDKNTATTQIQPKGEPDWYRPLCTACAVGLVRIELTYLAVPDIDAKVLAYRESIE